MVKAITIIPRSDNAGSSTTLDSVSYDGITINFSDSKTSDDFVNGSTDVSITDSQAPGYQTGNTYMIMNGTWPGDSEGSNIKTLSLNGNDLTTRYIPITFVPGDRAGDFINMFWAGHTSNVGSLTDNFEELKLVDITVGTDEQWNSINIYGALSSFDCLSGTVEKWDFNEAISAHINVDATNNHIAAQMNGTNAGAFNSNISNILWGKTYAIQIKPKASSGGGAGDTTAPTISEITPISTYTNDTTPSYTFTTDEAGTLTTDIAEGFTEGTSVSITGTGNQTVIFATLPEDTYSGQTITLTDADGNASTLTIPTFIIDTTNPIITLTGLPSITLNEGDTYTDAGATATDNPGSVNLTASITTTGTVNTSVAGTYTVTYNVTDAAGNTATAVTRTVTVTADTTAPIISQVTAIPTPSNNTTPSYTFTTDEAGTLTTTISQGFSGGPSVSLSLIHI